MAYALITSVGDTQSAEIWTVVSSLATVGILLVAGIASWWAKGQVQEGKHARQLSSLARLSDTWSSDLIRRARRIVALGEQNFEQVWRKLEEESSEDYFTLVALANFFEDLAILEKEGQLTLDQVIDRFGTTLIYYHKIYEGLISEQQKEDPSVLENFDKLEKRIRERTTS